MSPFSHRRQLAVNIEGACLLCVPNVRSRRCRHHGWWWWGGAVVGSGALQPTRSSGECRKLPVWGLGEAPLPTVLFCFCGAIKHILGHQNVWNRQVLEFSMWIMEGAWRTKILGLELLRPQRHCLYKGIGKGWYSFSWEPHLRATGCHSVTCHMTQVNAPHLTPAM